MTPAARDWLHGLRRFSEEHRAGQPPLAATVPSETVRHASPRGIPPSAAAQAAQAAILAELGEGWGARTLLELAAARPDAAIAMTTSPPGRGAFADLVAALPDAVAERVAIATEVEYRRWCMVCPDEAYELHVLLWSWIKAPLPPQRRGDFPRYPIADTDAYWLLRYGHEGQGEPWHSADLFSWDGRVATRLASGVTERFHSRG